jgi:ribonuclease HI
VFFFIFFNLLLNRYFIFKNVFFFMEYSWNLGVTTNNKAKAYAMYIGIQLAKKRKIIALNIVGDSKNTIHYFIKASSLKETSLENLVDRIKKTLHGLQAFFHILCHHNTVVDSLANKAIGLAHGEWRGACGSPSVK